MKMELLALKYLKNKLRRVRHENVYTQLPNISPEDLAKLIDRQLKLDNAQLRAADLKRKANKEDTKRVEKNRLREEEEQIKEILRQKQEREAYENRHTIKLYFNNHLGKQVKLPTFFTRSNSAFFKMCGFVLKEFDNGHVIWYPLLKDKKGEDRMFVEGSPNPMDIFKSKAHIISQIYGGKVDTNCDITTDGKPLLIDPRMFEDEKTGEKCKVIDLSDQKRKEFEHMVQQLSDDNSVLQNEIEKMRKQEIKYESDLAENNMLSSVAKEQSDIWAGKFASLFSRNAEIVKGLTDTLASIQDVKQEQILTERMNFALHRTVKDMRDKLEELSPMSQHEISSAKTMDTISRAIGMIEQAKVLNAPVIIKSTSGEVVNVPSKKKKVGKEEIVGTEEVPEEVAGE